MIGLDTNILIRFLTQDDWAQCARVDQLFADLTPQNPGFVALVTLAEINWVLLDAYGYTRAQALHALTLLINADSLAIERPDIARKALAHLGKHPQADFADVLIAQAGIAAGCAQVLTFDKRAANQAGMVLLV